MITRVIKIETGVMKIETGVIKTITQVFRRRLTDNSINQYDIKI